MTTTTLTRREQAAAEARASFQTMRADRRFLWLWLTVATLLSVAGNVGHAWVEAVRRASSATSSVTSDTLFWFALGWATAPPALLMLSIHGLPTLSRMLSSDTRDRLLTAVVWGVTIGAFGWSAVGIFEFTSALGVPVQLAWLAPLTIDLSVFGATRGLVLTAPMAARMKAGVASETTRDSAQPQVAALVEDHGGSVKPSAEAPRGRPLEPHKSSVKPSTEAPKTPTKTSAKPSVDTELLPFMDAAEQMVTEGVVARKTAAEVARVISAIDSGLSDNAIKSAGISSASTASKVRAAMTSDSRPLIAV